jgi:hypothetical protein
VGVHRSRYELERVLDRHGASDFAFVEADASAAIQFALQGRYVQLGLPLPDPTTARFTHTPTGRPRTVTAQERAYEQALREHWRALLLAVRGKLQSVESGISTFEDEFAGFLVPDFHEEKTARRKRPKAVNWLLGSSHSLAIALVAAFLVPASAVGAFALPPNVVAQLAAPFRGVLPDELAVPSEHARAVALGQSNWMRAETESRGARMSLAAERNFAASTPEGGAEPGSSAGGSGSSPSQGTGPVLSSGHASGGSGSAPGQAADGETSATDDESQPATDDSAQPSDGSETSDGGESTGDGSGVTVSDPDTDIESQPGDPSDSQNNGDDNGNGGGNGGGNGNGNGDDNGNGGDNGNDNDNGGGNGNGNGDDNGNGGDNGNHNGDDNGNGGDNGNHNGDDNGNHNGDDNGGDNGGDNGNHNGDDKGNKNGDDNGKKADTTGDDSKAGKGGPKAGP